MPNTFFGLSIAKSGLYASMTGITTTAHNISNAETKGYSRQYSSLEASKALRVWNKNGMIGTGVDVIGVDQLRSEYYDVKYRTNNTIYGEFNTKNYYLSEVENYFNEIKLEGFTTTFDKMFDTIQELQKNPTNLTVRTQMTNYANALCEYFNYVYSSVQKVQQEVNYEVYNEVSKINSIGVQVAHLTKQINTLEVVGGKASDLRDQRALLIDELSQIVDVDVDEIPVTQKTGLVSYTVRINGQLLVDTYHSNELKCEPRKSKNTMNDTEGLYDIFWKQDGQAFNLGDDTTAGSLKALFSVMDGNDRMAFKGMATAEKGAKTVTLVSDFTYMNEVQRMNLDRTGTLTIGNRDYDYNGFSVSQNDEGKYVYTFALDDEIVVGTDQIAPATEAVSGFQYNTIIGKDIDYKGIPYYLSKLNEFVRVFSDSYNTIAKEGVDLNGDAGLDMFNTRQVVTGQDYQFVKDFSGYGQPDVIFTSKSGEYAVEDDVENYGSYYFVTAGNLSINKEVAADPRKVVAAKTIANGIENSEIALKLLTLKNEHDMFRQGTPAQFLQTLVSEVGIDTSKAEQFAKNQEDVLGTISNQRLSVSGVDQDEEAMNLVRYQTAYQMSAKVVSVMNEIYAKMINEMGV